MWLAYNVYLVVKVVSRSSDFPRSIIKIAVHNTLWTFPFTLLLISKQRPSGPEGYLPTPYSDLIMPAYVVFAEAVLMGVWGFPDFPEGLYGVFFLGCVAAFFWGQFLATVSISRDLPITHAGGTSKAVFDRVRGAGRKMWSWASDLYDRVRNGVR
ncbi:hypothetical protein BC827DRAFT_49383 [Russula dissimulans]|nr:hypothetical protein BC827DRAFT_49383 [Russula dissimulans]